MKTIEITYRYDGTTTVSRPRPADADAARRRLDEGSRALAGLLETLGEGEGIAQRVIPVDPRDLGFQSGHDAAPRQRPYACVLGCSDARVPVELIFNEGPNDLFVVRVAGNGLGSDVLGSLRYAADHLADDLRLIVVLAHSGCGAVTSAADIFLNPRSYLALATQHALREMLDRLLLVVHASANALETVYGAQVTGHPSYREALIEISIVSNAALAAYSIEQELGRRGGLKAAYGVYLIDSREIWSPGGDGSDCQGLAWPPASGEAFGDFAAATVRSRRITSLLGEPAK